MKNLLTNGHLLLLFCLATVFAVSACATTGMQRSEDVQSSMQTVDNDIKRIVVQIESIDASLDELTKPGQSDLKRAFDLFSDNASKIKNMEKDFAKHADLMETSGEEYFAAWDSDKESYDNPEIQKQSDERRVELAKTYDKIAENNIGVKEAFLAYVSDINEIERFLSNDLTSEGITSISSISDDVVDNGMQLNNELKNLQNAIADARVKMRQS
ncbi:hypothetical protein [Rhodohalobacter barkolensis]|nr:hypothetical protein [Rhodohalobacter barkolensis]